MARYPASSQPAPLAEHDPVARLMVDVALSHLDRPFDYLVPADLDAVVGTGSRVRVRFAGRLVDGYVLERVAASGHDGRLARIDRAVGTEPVLTPETIRLFRTVADRWAGNFVDVVRLGVPPRHARAEAALTPPASESPTPAPGPSAPSASGPQHPVPAQPASTAPDLTAPDRVGWSRYPAGAAFLSAVTDARPARAVWSAVSGEDWPARLAETMAAAVAVGRGALSVVPDIRDLARLDAALAPLLGPAAYVCLTADLGPAERYRRWLAVRRGVVRAVIGTRAAAFAPVADLGLVAVWDDGDDLHVEPRAPYPHVRDLAVLRSAQTGAALLLAGYARTAEAQLLVQSGWAHEIVAARPVVRASAARVSTTGDDFEQSRDPAATTARLPSLALRTAREALAGGRPVLVQVPRAGYAPALACARDRTPARCAVCAGPLAARSIDRAAACRWCGRPAGAWTCPVCGGRRLRAVVVGAERTAEELGRAFPGTRVRMSSGGGTGHGGAGAGGAGGGAARALSQVSARPDLVVATPGAEPVAEGGYGAALLLDGWALLARADLRAGEETVRRWLNAAALVAADGQVIVAADAAVPAVQALLRWDPAGHAERELAEREELGFPPATRMAVITGPPGAVQDVARSDRLPPGTDRIGPVEAGPDVLRLLLRVPRVGGADLARSLHAVAAARSARKDPESLRIALDPAELG